MQRIPEPELMLDEEQAQAYAHADFNEPHSLFIELFQKAFPQWSGEGHVLDLGCGPGDISLRFARAFPYCFIHGVDGSEAMLNQGQKILAQVPEINSRIQLIQGVLPEVELPEQRYETVVSNSLLHHLHKPCVLWNTINHYAADGACIFIMDLRRPNSEQEAKGFVSRYAAGEPDVFRRDFYHSLLAAFQVEEVKDQLNEAGLHGLKVQSMGDRHMIIFGRLNR